MRNVFAMRNHHHTADKVRGTVSHTPVGPESHILITHKDFGPLVKSCSSFVVFLITDYWY